MLVSRLEVECSCHSAHVVRKFGFVWTQLPHSMRLHREYYTYRLDGVHLFYSLLLSLLVHLLNSNLPKSDLEQRRSRHSHWHSTSFPLWGWKRCHSRDRNFIPISSTTCSTTRCWPSLEKVLRPHDNCKGTFFCLVNGCTIVSIDNSLFRNGNQLFYTVWSSRWFIFNG